jgi:hypothetical protein
MSLNRRMTDAGTGHYKRMIWIEAETLRNITKGRT